MQTKYRNQDMAVHSKGQWHHLQVSHMHMYMLVNYLSSFVYDSAEDINDIKTICLKCRP